MFRAVVLSLALLVPVHHVFADTFVRIAGGVLVALEDDGSLAFRSLQVLPLEDGRVIKRVDGKWMIEPPDTSDIAVVKPVDLSVYGDRYVGRRVRVVGVLFGADAANAIMSLPGGAAYLDLTAVPGDALKRIIENCSRLDSSNGRCLVTATATVSPTTSRGKAYLTDVTIAWGDAGKTGIK